MNYQNVNSTGEGRCELISALGFASLILMFLQFFLWYFMYESATGLFTWQGVGLAGLAGAWLTCTYQYFVFKRGQGTQTVADFGRGYVAIKHGNLWGVFSAKLGKLFLPFEYDTVTVLPRYPDAKPKYLRLEQSGRVGLYSLVEWRIIIPLQFRLVIMMNNDFWAVQDLDNKWGMFSLKQDRFVMPVEYSGFRVWNSCYDFIGVPDGHGKIAIFSIADQEVVTPYVYDNIAYLGGGAFRLQKGLRKRRSDNHHLRFGIYVHPVRVFVEPEYSSIDKFAPGLLEIRTNNRLGLFSTELGKVVLPVIYWSIKRLPDEEVELQSSTSRQVVELESLKAG